MHGVCMICMATSGSGVQVVKAYTIKSYIVACFAAAPTTTSLSPAALPTATGSSPAFAAITSASGWHLIS